MTPDRSLLEEAREEAAKWFREVEKDLNAARTLTEIEPSRSLFFSQQAAEKSIKGFLTFGGIRFRKTHDLTDLGSQCAALDPTLESLLKKVAILTDYASEFGYPDAPYEPDVPEAEEAVALANLLFEEIRRRVG